MSRESSCKHGVQASVGATLRSQLYSPLPMLQGNHPPACKGHEVYQRCFAQLHVRTQACNDAGYDDVWGQNLVEISVMRYVSQVSGQQLKLIDN